MRLLETASRDDKEYPHLFIEVEPDKWVEVDFQGNRPTKRQARKFISTIIHNVEQQEAEYDFVTEAWIRMYLPDIEEVPFKRGR